MVRLGAYRLVMVLLCLAFLLALPVMGAQTTTVIDVDSTPIDGAGTEQEPYRYLINEDSKIAWKRLLENRERKITEVYEYRDGHTINGTLRYSYTFRWQDISANVSGPYFLGIRIYDREAAQGLPGYPQALFFSFATKRDLPGKTKVTLNVSDKFTDGTKLALTYYGGYDSTVIHGAAPAVAKDEIRQVASEVAQTAQDLTVSKGLVVFDVHYGGNYVLHPEPVDFSGFGAGEVIHYDADKVLGSIRSVFPTEKLAETIAAQLGKKKEDIITQGDLDSIKSLYLASIGLESAEELERVYFYRLESLTLAGNRLESLNSLAMPALTYLDVSGNRLKSVNALAALNALENVNLTGNELISLSDLSKLKNLQTFDLSNNRLQIIPSLESDRLRYLDLSGNSITRVAGGLEKCPNLERVVLTGQAFDTEAQIDVGEDFHLEPEPQFISQFGNGGRITITDSRGKVIFAEEYSALEEEGFRLKGTLFNKADQYTVTVTGTALLDGSEKKLGVYTYNLVAGNGPGTGPGFREMAALAVLMILLGSGAGLVLHARRQKKRSEESRL